MTTKEMSSQQNDNATGQCTVDNTSSGNETHFTHDKDTCSNPSIQDPSKLVVTSLIVL